MSEYAAGWGGKEESAQPGGVAAASGKWAAIWVAGKGTGVSPMDSALSMLGISPTKKSAVATSKEYGSFRSAVAKRSVAVEHGEEQRIWELYDFGPREVRCPLILIPPASGTADVYFKQQVSLGSAGFRTISVDAPAYWTHDEWCNGFLKLIDQLLLDQVHLFGSSLGGFLAQRFAQYTTGSQRVRSLTLCNSFTDTAFFDGASKAKTFKFMPAFVMKQMILDNYQKHAVEHSIRDSIDFMVERLDLIPREALASRLTLNMAPAYIEPQAIASQGIEIMSLYTLDQNAITSRVVTDFEKCYPEARAGQMKTGGNFPYLANDQEVNMFIKLVLRKFAGTRYSAGDDYEWSDALAGATKSGSKSGSSSPASSPAPADA